MISRVVNLRVLEALGAGKSAATEEKLWESDVGFPFDYAESTIVSYQLIRGITVVQTTISAAILQPLIRCKAFVLSLFTLIKNGAGVFMTGRSAENGIRVS